MMAFFRRRFILGAMLAFFILLALVIGSIVLVSYIQIERTAERFLENMLEETDEPFSQPAAPALFGYQLEERLFPAGFYDICTDTEGNIASLEARGIVEEAEISVQNYVADILLSDQEQGKVGAYKFRVRREADGSARMILLDNSIALRGLMSTLWGALAVGAVCLLLMLIILQPVATRAARSYLRNAEKQKQFITNAGHEIKTPVAIVLASLDAMELHQGENRWSRNIREQMQRLSALLGQLLLLAKTDETQLNAMSKSVDFSSILSQAIEACSDCFAARKLQRVEDISTAQWVRGSANALRQMLDVLLDNAAKYAAAGGTVFIRLAPEARKTVFSIENNVQELPARDPESLFERFYRGEVPRQGDGCGIGLSAAKSIAELHRGRIRAVYPDEHTLRITVELPRVRGKRYRANGSNGLHKL